MGKSVIGKEVWSSKKNTSKPKEGRRGGGKREEETMKEG